MNAIQIKGSFSMVKRFYYEGGELLNNAELDNVLCKHILYLKNIGNKDNTILEKTWHIYLFLNYIQKKNLKSIINNDIYDYTEECVKLSWGDSIKSRSKLVLKLFFNWTYENNITTISGNVIFPKIVWHRNTNIRTYYTKDEIQKLLNVIDIKTRKGKEDYLIISIICYLGLRISDVINLKMSNINFNENTISIIQYKTNKKLILPLIDSIKYPLLDYLKNVRPLDCDLDYIFLTNEKPYRQKIELKHHGTIVRRYFIKANVNINGRKAGFHSLRHSFSTMLLNENVDLYSVSSILGHQALDTTMLYLDINISKLKELALEVPIC